MADPADPADPADAVSVADLFGLDTEDETAEKKKDAKQILDLVVPLWTGCHVEVQHMTGDAARHNGFHCKNLDNYTLVQGGFIEQMSQEANGQRKIRRR